MDKIFYLWVSICFACSTLIEQIIIIVNTCSFNIFNRSSNGALFTKMVNFGRQTGLDVNFLFNSELIWNNFKVLGRSIGWINTECHVKAWRLLHYFSAIAPDIFFVRFQIITKNCLKYVSGTLYENRISHFGVSYARMTAVISLLSSDLPWFVLSVCFWSIKVWSCFE